MDNNSSKIPSGFLLQSGNSLNGNFLISGSCSGVGNVQGQLSGSNVSLSLDAADQSLNFTGTAKSDGTSMSGNYSVLAAGCGFSSPGTWTANRVSDLTGNFQGIFTSVITPNLTFHFSGTLTQGANTGSSYAALSGSMTSTDATCFTSASISGQISGTAVVFNLLNANGVALGKIDGNIALDASSMSGNYYFINAKNPLACGSDFGTVVLAITGSAG